MPEEIVRDPETGVLVTKRHLEQIMKERETKRREEKLTGGRYFGTRRGHRVYRLPDGSVKVVSTIEGYSDSLKTVLSMGGITHLSKGNFRRWERGEPLDPREPPFINWRRSDLREDGTVIKDKYPEFLIRLWWRWREWWMSRRR